MSFARKQDNTAVKSLGAKKIDIDFGSDDFFNSFQPVAAVDEKANPFGKVQTSMTGGEQKTNKLKELDSDPFGFGQSGNDRSAGGGGGMSINLGGEDESMMNEKDAAARLKQLGNRKAISSEDFIDYSKDVQDVQDRMSAMQVSNATQISSDMVFNNASSAAAPSSSQHLSLSN